MSVDNPYLLEYGWKIDPDNRQDRSSGPCTTRKMTDEEIRKYGIFDKMESEGTVMRKPLPIIKGRAIEICQQLGKGKAAAEKIAEEFKVEVTQAQKYIDNHIGGQVLKTNKQKAREAVQKDHSEKTAEEISAINSHEDHPESTTMPQQPIDTEEYPDIKDAAREIGKEFNQVAKDSMDKVKLAHAVDEMLEMLPDPEVDHPVHYTAGKFETIDFIQDKLTSEEFEGFCKGTVLQYIIRCRLKGGVKDLKKAEWYLKRLIQAKESA